MRAKQKQILLVWMYLKKLQDQRKEFIKYCKQFEQHLHFIVQFHQVASKIQEESTDIMIPCFITGVAARGKERLGDLKVNLQFPEHHKVQYLEVNWNSIKN